MRGIPRRIVALAAAYALALQALLSVVGAASALGVQGTEFELCRPRADAGGAPAQPATHESCLACLAGHCAHAGLDRAASIAPWYAPSVASARSAHHAGRVTLTPRPRPHGARAPPAA